MAENNVNQKAESDEQVVGGAAAPSDETVRQSLRFVDSLRTKVFKDKGDLSLPKIQDLVEIGAFVSNPQRFPTYYNTDSKDRSLKNVIRALIDQAEKPEDSVLKHLSENELQQALDELSTPKVAMPDNYVKPPVRFGQEPLCKEDRTECREFRKDLTGHATLEAGLEWLVNYHEKQEYKFSETALQEALRMVLPGSTYTMLQTLIGQNRSLAEIYKTLQWKMGSRKTSAQIRSDVLKLTGSNEAPIKVLENLFSLLHDSGESFENVDKMCLQEARRYLQERVFNNTSMAALEAHFQNGDPCYADYLRVLKERFASDLIMRPRRINEVVTVGEDDTPTKSLTDELATLKKDFVNSIKGEVVNELRTEQRVRDHERKGQGKSQGARPKTSKQSSVKNGGNGRNFNPANVRAYCDSQCVIHPNSRHRNKDCFLQKLPCDYSPNHGGHEQGQCRRNLMDQHARNQQSNRPFPKQQMPQQPGYRGNNMNNPPMNPMFNQYPQQNMGNYPMPIVNAQPTVHQVNQQPLATTPLALTSNVAAPATAPTASTESTEKQQLGIAIHALQNIWSQK